MKIARLKPRLYWISVKNAGVLTDQSNVRRRYRQQSTASGLCSRWAVCWRLGSADDGKLHFPSLRQCQRQSSLMTDLSHPLQCQIYHSHICRRYFQLSCTGIHTGVTKFNHQSTGVMLSNTLTLYLLDNLHCVAKKYLLTTATDF